MAEENCAMAFSRRTMLKLGTGCVCGAWIALPCAAAEAEDEALTLIEHMIGTRPTPSDRVHLMMPSSFPNGYTVPLSLAIDSPMTEAEHVRYVKVLAPRNPIVEVATFRFTPARSQARVATRIRLAEPQFVLAAAAMNDGAVLMAKTWVDVASNGCK